MKVFIHKRKFIHIQAPFSLDMTFTVSSTICREKFVGADSLSFICFAASSTVLFLFQLIILLLKRVGQLHCVVKY